jgi:hypothetical protein
MMPLFPFPQFLCVFQMCFDVTVISRILVLFSKTSLARNFFPQHFKNILKLYTLLDSLDWTNNIRMLTIVLICEMTVVLVGQRYGNFCYRCKTCTFVGRLIRSVKREQQVGNECLNLFVQ